MIGPTHLLVAGVGNVFLGDDGFGVEVVRRLRDRPQPPGVAVVDFGIRGLDLGLALARCEAAILIDTVLRGGAPGTLYLLEPDRAARGAADPHAMTPDRLLAWLPEDATPWLRIVGCEPSTFEPDPDGRLSAPVDAAVDAAIQMIEQTSREWLARLADA